MLMAISMVLPRCPGGVFSSVTAHFRLGRVLECNEIVGGLIHGVPEKLQGFRGHASELVVLDQPSTAVDYGDERFWFRWMCHRLSPWGENRKMGRGTDAEITAERRKNANRKSSGNDLQSMTYVWYQT
jgi:hypothetical protein